MEQGRTTNRTVCFYGKGVSHPGLVRELNEDSFLVKPDSGIWLVADGMGGHEAGEKASACIVDHLSGVGVSVSLKDLRARFFDRITSANREIFDASQAKDGSIMGSTVAALLTYGDEFACVWSGDSRVYQIRDGALRSISRDHTEVQELLDRQLISAEEARNWHNKNVITRAIGVTPDIDIEVKYGTAEVGDMYILCSDGLTEHLSDQEILDLAYGRMPAEACETLLAATIERGAVDNVTIIVINCRSESSTLPASGLLPEDVFKDRPGND